MHIPPDRAFPTIGTLGLNPMTKFAAQGLGKGLLPFGVSARGCFAALARSVLCTLGFSPPAAVTVGTIKLSVFTAWGCAIIVEPSPSYSRRHCVTAVTTE